MRRRKSLAAEDADGTAMAAVLASACVRLTAADLRSRRDGLRREVQFEIPIEIRKKGQFLLIHVRNTKFYLGVMRLKLREITDRPSFRGRPDAGIPRLVRASLGLMVLRRAISTATHRGSVVRLTYELRKFI